MVKQARREFVYLMPGVLVGLASLTVLTAGVLTMARTLVVWVGVPLLAGILATSRMFADLERRRMRVLTGRQLPAVDYRPVAGTGLGRLRVVLTDPQVWRDTLHGLLMVPLATFTGAVMATWLSVAVLMVLEPLYGWLVPQHLMWGRLTISGYFPTATLFLPMGLVLLVTIPPVLHTLVSAHVALARALLGNETAALRARAEQLTASRAAVVEAEAQTLRRVERDIHDGPQQRLVRLGMDLEAVCRRLDDNPDAVRALVEGALAQSRAALAELRAVSRGIAPPILADRGLAAAVAAAVARCPVDASLDCGLATDQRLPAPVENAAYFVVSEALTNVAKHARASHCGVTVSREEATTLQVVVTDDGRGGAHLGKGHGLAGLADRLAGVDGALDLHSPVGGPTVLTARIPL